MPKPRHETYFAPALMPDGTDSPVEVEFGRGDITNPRSNANYSFASIPTTPSEHTPIVEHLAEAAGGETITRKNAAQVLAKAVDLARKQ